VIEINYRELWEREYSYLAKRVDRTEPVDAFEAWRNYIRNLELLAGDEFTRYCPKGAGTAIISDKTTNPIH
jgi:hypothetical protein